jgi:acyl CoA:acetate/3-ketoacid CoA transferase
VFAGARKGQRIRIVTERAVFRADADGLTLIEVAPGIDIQKHILDQMDYAPVRIAPDLKYMNLTVFEQSAVPALAAI